MPSFQIKTNIPSSTLGTQPGGMCQSCEEPDVTLSSASEDKECKGRGGTQLQHSSATVINDSGILQQPSKHCELTVNRRD